MFVGVRRITGSVGRSVRLSVQRSVRLSVRRSPRRGAVVRARPAAARSVERRVVVVPVARIDAAAVATLSAARASGGRVLAVHVTHAGERAGRDALVAAWDASGVDVTLSVVHADGDLIAEPLVTFVRGLPERNPLVRLPGPPPVPGWHRSTGSRGEQVYRALRAAGVDVASTPGDPVRVAGASAKARLAPAA
ncbi:hypothetical protein [Streptomyces sp. SID3343]|uniref:hypothetical protein n=1 Tax=Streptomyces sp. SID3343 TaxID=2690260 RepID=UPI00136AF114|nr:hypothetical protein [Streptomyces sp. SID3343]MYV98571.1 hypothetical protein [Streptomyces sp. SID3343]